MITFCPRAFFFFATVESPTARIAIGIAASKTCPIFKPEYAAAAENNTAMTIPHPTDQPVISGGVWSAVMIGVYDSPSFSSLYAFPGRPFADVVDGSIRVLLLSEQ